MKYRIAQSKDYISIIQMKNRVKNRIINANLPIWLNGYPSDEIISEDIINNYGRVIEKDGKIISYAVLYPSHIEYENKLGNITDLYSFGRVMVDDGYTKMGIGKFLVQNMINEAKINNQKGMLITADDINIKAVNLYQSFGFKKIGEKQFPYAYLSIFKLDF